MNFIHSKTQECTKSELDLFSVPPTQVSLEKGHWIDHQPVSSVADGGTITYSHSVSRHRRLRGFVKNDSCGESQSDKS